MNAPLTWRNLSNHDLPDPLKASAMGQAGLERAMTGINKMFDDQLQRTADGELNRFKQGLYGKSVEDLQAGIANGSLSKDIMGRGTGINASDAQSMIEGRLTALQQRNVANQQYADQQVDIAGRPIAASYQSALAQTTTPDGVKSLMESINTATGAGVVDPRLAAQLTEKALGRQNALVTEQRAAQDQVWQGQNYQNTWAHQANQDRIARAKLQIDRDNLTEQRTARQAATNEAGIRTRTAHLTAAGDLIKNQTAAIQEVKRNTPYAEMFGGANIDLISKAATTANGADAKYGNAVVDKITELRKTMPDIPVDVITSAISMAKNDFFDFAKGRNGYADSVVGHIKDQMKDPTVMGKVAFANEQIAKAQGTYNGSTLDPKPEPAKPVPAALPPQLTFNPPKVSSTGALTYDKPGSFNISSNKGIMTPSKMPIGNMDVTVKDGDTIGVKGANGVSMDFRFNGLDAQETGKTINGKTSQGQKYSEEAKAFITNAFKSGKVDIRVASNKPDAYGRLVADVYVGGESLNEALLRKGFATVLAIEGGIGPSQKAAFDLNAHLAMRNNAGIMSDLNSDSSPTGAAYRMFGDNLYK
jgi:endonuclease YncB( thermonuclease family)